MKTSLITLLTLLICSFTSIAQNQNASSTIFEGRKAIKIEYFGELVLHPGLSVGMEYTIKRTNLVNVHWDTDLGGYWHRWNNTSAFLKTSIGSRLALGSAFADLNLGTGYMHSWAAGDVYQKDNNGGVEKAANTGHSHLMLTTSLLFGWDGSRKKNLPWTIYVGPEVYLQSSFNHTFLPHVAAKIGITYKLNNHE